VFLSELSFFCNDAVSRFTAGGGHAEERFATVQDDK